MTDPMSASQKNNGRSNKAVKPRPDWYYGTARFAVPSLTRAIIQILDTFVPYVLLLSVVIYLVKAKFPYWLALPPIVIAAGLLVRIFIIFHDCVHNSFFASRRANTILGTICGILTCTPYADWQWTHSRHHATAADLDNRGFGSVWTMTVKEYRTAPLSTRICYRLYRNPLVMFIPGPVIMFLIINRLPTRGIGRRQKISVLITNLAVLLIFAGAVWGLGLWNVCRIAIPLVFISSSAEVWLFYIQHQFEGVSWFRHEKWDLLTASLKGCSYYKLPNVLHWMTANIGLHHLHHTRTAIPNYNLQQCFNETPELQEINVLTIRRSLKSLWLNLWDEDQNKLVSFREIACR